MKLHRRMHYSVARHSFAAHNFVKKSAGGGESPPPPCHTTVQAGPAYGGSISSSHGITTWAGRSQFGDAVRVSLLGLASVAASPRCAYPRPAEAGWPVQYPHRDPSTTNLPYRSGLRRSRDYYALC